MSARFYDRIRTLWETKVFGFRGELTETKLSGRRLLSEVESQEAPGHQTLKKSVIIISSATTSSKQRLSDEKLVGGKKTNPEKVRFFLPAILPNCGEPLTAFGVTAAVLNSV